MAPAPAPPSRRGLDLRNPGAKEIVIVAAGAAGLFLLFRWLKNRQQPSATTETPADTGTSGPATPTGLNTAQFLAWIRDHQSSTTTTRERPETKAQEAAEERREHNRKTS